MEDSTHKRKRVRDDSEADSPELKTHRVGLDSDVSSSESQLTRMDSGESYPNSDDSVPDSASAREIQDDLLNILDDNDNVPERDSTIQGLDSVIKSFEEEILAPGPDPVDSDSTRVPESGELQPNLGYLFEASDDELGLPPTVTPGEEGKPVSEPGRVGPEGVDVNGFMGFEDDVFHSYDAFGFGTGLLAERDCDDGGAGGFATGDGLFDYAETADILWRSESLQAM